MKKLDPRRQAKKYISRKTNGEQKIKTKSQCQGTCSDKKSKLQVIIPSTSQRKHFGKKQKI
jgi:hypothetical protein